MDCCNSRFCIAPIGLNSDCHNGFLMWTHYVIDVSAIQHHIPTCSGPAQRQLIIGSSIFDTMSGFLGGPISPCPLVVLFGVLPDHLGLTRAQSNSVAFLTLLARRLILIKWKDCKPPTFTHWVKDVLYFLKLEKIRYSLKGSAKNYNKTWGPFLDYVQKRINRE